MHQAVPAEKHVRSRKLVAGEIDDRETPTLACVKSLVLFDNRRNDVAADVVDAFEVDVLHPREIAARDVEQHARFEPAKRRW
jgi:hypothetical protein